MKIIDKINKNKELVVTELYQWAETFIGEMDDEGEETMQSYDYVFDLAERLEKNEFNDKDYQDIIFHIEQINHNEIVIKL